MRAVQVKGLKMWNYPGCSKGAQSNHEASKWSRSPGWGAPRDIQGLPCKWRLQGQENNIRLQSFRRGDMGPPRPRFQPSDTQLYSCPGEQDNPSGWFKLRQDQETKTKSDLLPQVTRPPPEPPAATLPPHFPTKGYL